jgi:hypothetical protein
MRVRPAHVLPIGARRSLSKTSPISTSASTETAASLSDEVNVSMAGLPTDSSGFLPSLLTLGAPILAAVTYFVFIRDSSKLQVPRVGLDPSVVGSSKARDDFVKHGRERAREGYAKVSRFPAAWRRRRLANHQLSTRTTSTLCKREIWSGSLSERDTWTN